MGGLPKQCAEGMTEGMAAGAALFDAGRYFEAHEVWEDYWREEHRPVRELYQALVQVASAFIQHGRQRPAGAKWLLERAFFHLAAFPDCCHGVDVAALRRQMERMRDELAAGSAPSAFLVPRCGD